MENIKNFDKAKEIIKNNLISRVESINYATSEDKYFEYLKGKDVSDSELEIARNKEKKEENGINMRLKLFISTYLINTPVLYILLFYISDHFYNDVFLAIFVFLLISFGSFILCYVACYVESENTIEYIKKNASPNELKDLYKKEFKANIEDYLSLSKQEIKELCDSNEFIMAYIKKNPNEIFTRYSLNKVAGIKMNNLHMINEFKDIIDNKKILDGLPDGQKIFINDIIMKEQKLN